MTGPPGGVPPPKEAAAQGPTRAADGKSDDKCGQAHHTKNRVEQLLEMAFAVMRDGELGKFVPAEPAWYRRIGHELFGPLLEGQEADPHHRRQLELVYAVARARREGAGMGPTHPGPTHGSLQEARAALHDAFEGVLAATLEYHSAAMPNAA